MHKNDIIILDIIKNFKFIINEAYTLLCNDFDIE
jgi:hypothetical protein